MLRKCSANAPQSLPPTCCTAWAWRWPPPTPSTAAASTLSAACRARSPKFLQGAVRRQGDDQGSSSSGFLHDAHGKGLPGPAAHVPHAPSGGQQPSSHTTQPLRTRPAPPTVRHSTWRPLPPSPARRWTGSGPAHSTVPPCTPAHPGAQLHACPCCKACRGDGRQPCSEARWWPRHGQQRRQC